MSVCQVTWSSEEQRQEMMRGALDGLALTGDERGGFGRLVHLGIGAETVVSHDEVVHLLGEMRRFMVDYPQNKSKVRPVFLRLAKRTAVPGRALGAIDWAAVQPMVEFREYFVESLGLGERNWQDEAERIQVFSSALAELKGGDRMDGEGHVVFGPNERLDLLTIGARSVITKAEMSQLVGELKRFREMDLENRGPVRGPMKIIGLRCKSDQDPQNPRRVVEVDAAEPFKVFFDEVFKQDSKAAQVASEKAVLEDLARVLAGKSQLRQDKLKLESGLPADTAEEREI